METMMMIRVNNHVVVAQPQNPEVLHQLGKLAEVKNLLKKVEKILTVLKKSSIKFRAL